MFSSIQHKAGFNYISQSRKNRWPQKTKLQAACSINLNVPLPVGLELLQVLLEVDSLALGHRLEHVLPTKKQQACHEGFPSAPLKAAS